MRVSEFSHLFVFTIDETAKAFVRALDDIFQFLFLDIFMYLESCNNCPNDLHRNITLPESTALPILI